ncbi:protein-L-isoaspartate(D-aspartate) O-methyltransferase [Pontibacter diazotrophicus]|uniref:Protein-L-isoaspartate O-methyltransferase n=2 Tax=Pontibacter diazotrophicus TaxID=1400979 RepID=A0A3D8LH48_9BACT|nr:protein-L-isoaspartate(D-aspartate) O-methyltransferase [Pontibacter diazotrophicus]RDV16564.1 protein-L-isoaspartate(D-aspartate) O-methyltransferase [Pontibacter diazotrophicus]
MLYPVSSLLFLMLLFFPVQEDVYKERRERMVQRNIEARGIKDEAVLDAMRKVERHKFVPPQQASQAYADNPLPIGHKQTISQPFIVAYMTEVIRPNPQMKVLEIGTGSGYQAAVLAEIVKEVYTIEIVPEHGKAAAEKLKELGYDNVQVKIGDGYKGWEAHAPYDAIIVTAGAEAVPPPLLEQLKEGGRMVIPVGPQSRTQTLTLIEKKNGRTITQNLMPVVFVPFTGDGKN